MDDRKYKIKEEIAWRKMRDGSVTIVSPVIDKIITINETAGIVWEMLDGTNTVSDICVRFRDLFKESSVSGDAITKDVLEIVENFVKKELIE